MDSKDTNDSYRPIFDDSRKTRWLSISMRTEHHPFGQPIYSYRHLSTDVGAIDFIFEKSKSLYNNSGYTLKPSYKLWISLFASSMKLGDKHDAHFHPGAIYSGIIYLQVPKKSSPIQFKSPKDEIFNTVFDKINKKENIFNYEDDGTVNIFPDEGMFLMWDSWAIHRVPINDLNINDERITMVFNVGVDVQ